MLAGEGQFGFAGRGGSFADRHRGISAYFLISVLVTLMDVLIVWVLRNGFRTGVVAANTAGVVSGSVLQYFLVSRHVFRVKYGVSGALVFFGTVLPGLLLADWVIWLFSTVVLRGMDRHLNLLVSKAFSIVIPFFVIYGLRKYLFGLIGEKGGNRA